MQKKLKTLLKEARIKSGLSQKDVSKKLGYTSSQFISNFERGVADPPLKTLQKLISLYNLNIDDVFCLMVTGYEEKLASVLKPNFRIHKSKTRRNQCG